MEITSSPPAHLCLKSLQKEVQLFIIPLRTRIFHDEDRGFFLLGADIQTLVTNDALPVSHFGRYGRLLCMETKDSSKILDHIRHAEVFIPENVSLTITEGASCARISRDIQGLEWPEFRPDTRPG